MRRGLTRAQGFALFVAVCNRPEAARELIASLDESMPWLGIAAVELEAGTEDMLAEVLARLPPDREGAAMVTGLERSVPSSEGDHPVLRTLNLSRPEWPRRLARPVVLWVPEYLLPLLAREAPDFLDWRSDTLHFPALTDREHVALDSRPHWGQASGDMTVEQRGARIEELRARLATPWSPSDLLARSARFDWFLELGDQLRILGEIEEAMCLYRQALGLSESRLNAAESDRSSQALRDRSMAWGRIAVIFETQGDLDEALRIWREEEIPTYEKLGSAADLVTAHTIVSEALLDRGSPGDAEEARRRLATALPLAEKMKLPRVNKIRALLERAGGPPPEKRAV